MKKRVSAVILLSTVFFPFLLIGGFVFVGATVPLEGKVIENSSFLSASEEELQVVFFGYAGCSFICPTSLFTLGEVLDEIHEKNKYAGVGGIFVDVNASVQIQRAHEYGQYFSEKISGYNVTEEELKDLKSDFGLNVIGSGQPGEEIVHTDHFFIVKKTDSEWKVLKVIANQVNRKELNESIKEFLVQNNYSQIASR
ncbi:MAG: SCO family protein [Balneolales bacterium]|nr:SCO family protein [Balneolales bacterium]